MTLNTRMLCYYTHITYVGASANDFILPSNFYGGATTHDATFLTAQAGSLFASGGAGMNPDGKPKTCVIYGLAPFGKAANTTNPNELTIVDAIAGTTEITRLRTAANPVGGTEFFGYGIPLPPNLGWAAKITTTDATGIWRIYWGFL